MIPSISLNYTIESREIGAFHNRRARKGKESDMCATKEGITNNEGPESDDPGRFQKHKV